MKYELIKEAGRNILKVDVLGAPEVISQAEIIAESKAEYIHKDDPSGKTRQQSEIISQNFLGALADIACTRLIRTYFKKHDIPLKIESYDEVREDNFEKPDLYDIRVSSETTECVIEVRSSICLKMQLKSLINYWHILGPYQTDIKGDYETKKEFYIRPVFHLKRWSDNRNKSFYRRSDGMKLLKDGEIDLYILGGANAEIMSSDKAWDEGGETLKQGKSNFRVVYIKDGLQPNEFLESIVSEMIKD